MAYVYDDLDFTLDGYSAKTNGIIMQAEPTISPIEQNIEEFVIPGRSGSLHYVDGTVKNRTIKIPCYAVKYDSTRDDGYYTGGDGVYAKMTTAAAFLFPNAASPQAQGVRKLKIGYNLTYYKAIIVNGAEIAARLKTLSPFTIEFTVDPIRYLIADDSAVGL